MSESMYPEVITATLADWLAYLEQLHPKAIDMGLDRVKKVRAELGLIPDFPVIIVGGTNGKGSVCAIFESILTTAGYNVGCYTSPHLVRYNERIRIQQVEATNQQLIQAFSHINNVRRNCGVSLTYFEFGTLAAMYLMVEEQVDVAILEVGLGGRLDAVNIFDADCAILTSIGLDHIDYLGNSREAIGYEKAGIFRSNKPAICSEPDLPLTVSQFAENNGSQLLIIDRDFGFNCKSGQRNQWEYWSCNGRQYSLPLPALQGQYQLQNASACLTALEMLSDRLSVDIRAIRHGLLKTVLPGRFQIVSHRVSHRPLIILDVAHNPHAALGLAVNLANTRTSGKTYAVLAMLQDKDISGVMQAIKCHVDVWLLSSIDTPRSAKSYDLLQQLYKLDHHYEKHAFIEFSDVVSAYRYACKHAAINDRICVLGSFYTVGAVLQYQERRQDKR